MQQPLDVIEKKRVVAVSIENEKLFKRPKERKRVTEQLQERTKGGRSFASNKNAFLGVVHK